VGIGDDPAAFGIHHESRASEIAGFILGIDGQRHVGLDLHRVTGRLAEYLLGTLLRR
jgi:hypothetical protein